MQIKTPARPNSERELYRSQDQGYSYPGSRRQRKGFLHLCPCHVTAPGHGDHMSRSLRHTAQDPTTATASLRFTTIGEMTEHVLGLLNEGDTNFHQAFPASHIIFAPITGLDIKRFPLLADMDPYHQYVVNASMAQINAGLIAINERNHVPTPWTTRHTHRLRKKRSGQSYVQHRYDLLRDGYHPTSKLLKYWASALVSTVWHCT